VLLTFPIGADAQWTSRADELPGLKSDSEVLTPVLIAVGAVAILYAIKKHEQENKKSTESKEKSQYGAKPAAALEASPDVSAFRQQDSTFAEKTRKNPVFKPYLGLQADTLTSRFERVPESDGGRSFLVGVTVNY